MSDGPSSTDVPLPFSTAGTSDKVEINRNIFIPVAVVIASIFFLGAIVTFRHRIIDLFRRIFHLAPRPAIPILSQAENGQRPSISAEQLAGTTAAPTPAAGSGSAAPTTAAAARGRRARRGVRRTDSGTSIRTLPVYSKEAGDEELVLVRRQSMGSVDEADEAEAVDEGNIEMRERRTSLRGVLDRVASLRRSGSIRSIASAISRRSLRPLTETAPPSTPPIAETTDEQPSSPQSAPPRVRPLSQSGSVRSRGWGEAPTYLEAMSSPLPDAQTQCEQPIETPPRSTLRERTSSTFLTLLSRTGLVPGPSSSGHHDPYSTSRSRNPPSSSQNRRPSSSVSLLLRPQTSRLSGRSFDPTTSAYPSPWTSTHSLGLISPPVANSAVRASFEINDLPRSGLSDEQMRFLGTREATNLAGVRVGDVPIGKRRRGSTAPSSRNVSGASGLSGMSGSSGEDGSLPTWDELDGERRRAEAEQGRGRADVLLAGGAEVGTITVEPGPEAPSVGESAMPASASTATIATTPTNSAPSSTTPATSTLIPTATPPPPPSFDIVAPTPTSPTFPSRLPLVSTPSVGT